MIEIRYINDKTRIYLYDILSKQRKLNKKERNDFNRLKEHRVWDEKERSEILSFLKSKGYIEQMNNGLIGVDRNGRKLYGSLSQSNLQVTKFGEDFLKKELKSEYREELFKRRLDVLDRLIAAQSIVLIIVGWFLNEIVSLIKALLQWLTQLISA